MSADPAPRPGARHRGSDPALAATGNPLARAWDLEQRRGRRYLRGPGWRVAGLVLLAAVLAWLVRTGPQALIAAVGDNLASLVLACAALAALVVGRERERAARDLFDGWLASTPLAPARVREALRHRVARRSAYRLAVVLLTAMAAALAAHASWLGGAAASALGLALGAAAGWRLARHPARSRPPAPPRLARRMASGGDVAGLRALSRWPFATLRADANPRLHAIITGPLLMALPDMPLARALALLMLLALAVLAWSLAAATLKTLGGAADWLGSAPLGRRRRQWAVLRKVAASMLVLVAAMVAIAPVPGLPGWLVPASAVAGLAGAGALVACGGTVRRQPA